MISLDDLEKLESAVHNWGDFDLNYSSVENVDCDGETLTKYPFNYDNATYRETLEIHKAWRKLYHLIKELKQLKKNQSYAQVAVNLVTYTASTAVDKEKT